MENTSASCSCQIDIKVSTAAIICLCSFCRVVVLESRPTDNPTALSNLYILAGHENSYWASLPDRAVHRNMDKMPQFWEKTPDFHRSLRVEGNVWFQTVFVTDHGIDRSVKEEPLQSGFMSSLTPATRSLWRQANRHEQKVEKRETLKWTLLLSIFLTLLYCGMSYKQVI